MKNADERSLVLLDELGGGTDPAEGEAMAKSILEFLHNKNTRTAVTTHISQLRNLGYTVKGVENASIGFDLETLRLTYRLLMGISGKSNALSLAKRLGLPNEVIRNAESQFDGDKTGDLLNHLQAVKSEIIENKKIAETAKLNAELAEQGAIGEAKELEDQLKLAKHQNGEKGNELLQLVKIGIMELLEKEPSKKSLLKSLEGFKETLNFQGKPKQNNQIKIDEKVYIKRKKSRRYHFNESTAKDSCSLHRFDADRYQTRRIG